MTQDSKFSIFRFVQFLKTDIWRIRAITLSGQKSFWIRQLRIVLLALRGFNEDKCQGVAQTKALRAITDSMTQFHDTLTASSANVLLKDINV